MPAICSKKAGTCFRFEMRLGSKATNAEAFLLDVFLSMHNILSVGYRFGLLASLLLRSHPLVTRTECGFDVAWIAAYVAPKPLRTFKH